MRNLCNISKRKPIFHCDTKPFALGPRVGLDPQSHNFALGILSCWYLKALKFVLPLTPNLKFALPPTRTPNASQWNIGWVRLPGVGAGVGHVDFMLFVLISFALVTQCEPSLQWNMGFTISILPFKVSKAYSKTWSFRDESLTDMQGRMMAFQGSKEEAKVMMRAAIFLDNKALKDKVYAVSTVKSRL